MSKKELDQRFAKMTGSMQHFAPEPTPKIEVEKEFNIGFPISLELFKELTEKQRLLDAAIIKEKGITEPIHPDHIELAYRLEIAETINEMKGDVKYWSDKEAQHPEFLEEYVDALHFLLSWTYQEADRKRHTYHYLEGEDRISYKYRELCLNFTNHSNDIHLLKKDNIQDWEVALLALKAADMFTSFTYLTLIAKRYGIIEKDIKAAYDTKNKVNFERLANGY